MAKRSITTNLGITFIRAEMSIDKSKNQVWEVLKAIGEIEKFHPLIKQSNSLSDLKSGVGARRHCKLLPMGEMSEEVAEWNEGESITMEVVDGKMLPPFEFMRGHIELHELGTQTQVVFTLSYKLKYGFVGKIMNVLLIKPQFKKAPPKYVGGLKDYVESV